MKTIKFLTTAAFILFSAACFSQVKVNDQGCSDIKNGTFSIQKGFFGFLKADYIIQRDSDKQIEVDGSGKRYIFNVNWINDCSYKLTLQQIVDNPEGNEISDQPILVEITEVTHTGYKNRITMDVDGYTITKTTTAVKENPNEYRYLNELLNN